jgi:hypothetical protein
MKIGIITLWGCGYGQNLQAYALQTFLRNAGHDTYLIRYPSINYNGENHKALKMFLPPILLFLVRQGKKVFSKEILRQMQSWYSARTEIAVSPFYKFYRDHTYEISLRGIVDFFNDNLYQSKKFYASFAELQHDPPEADAYIVGSDQVWSFWGMPLDIAEHETIRAYFLDFGKPETKRIAYAASFGTRKMNQNDIKIMTPLLKKFSYISVREQANLGLFNMCGIHSVEWVPDPTLLLTAERYRILYKQIKNTENSEPYCLVYMLRDNLNFLKAVYDWAEQKKISIRLIMNNGLVQHVYPETFATIPEWIQLIDKANYVITDSYHGSVLSFIFGKRFGLIPFTGCESDLRVNDLFKRFGKQPPFIKNENFSILDIDFDNADVMLKLEEIYRTYNAAWIQKILSM